MWKLPHSSHDIVSQLTGTMSTTSLAIKLDLWPLSSMVLEGGSSYILDPWSKETWGGLYNVKDLGLSKKLMAWFGLL